MEYAAQELGVCRTPVRSREEQHCTNLRNDLCVCFIGFPNDVGFLANQLSHGMHHKDYGVCPDRLIVHTA